jgi:uncharacterized membrane protein
MTWNAALALIPVLLTIVFFKRDAQPRQGIRNLTFGFEVALVLLFLPNAPYVATDLVHFMESVRTSDASLWQLLGKEFPWYVGLVGIGLSCYSFTVDRLLHAFRMRFGQAAYWIALFGISLLSAIGVYLGRVARYNSWDILSDPRGILHSGTTALDRLRFAKVIVSMWLALIVVHQIYRIFHDGIRYRVEEYRRRHNAANAAMDS